MSQYTGSITVGGRQYAIEVSADSSRLHATANGATVFDKKYFVNAGKRDVPIKIGGRAATLRWEMVSSARGACSIEADGTLTPLAQRMKSGEVKGPLTAVERSTIQIWIMGAVLTVFAAFLFLRSWVELQDHQRYYNSLGVVPLLFIAGILFLLRPKATAMTPYDQSISEALSLSALESMCQIDPDPPFTNGSKVGSVAAQGNYLPLSNASISATNACP
jgi:hypothetical protein